MQLIMRYLKNLKRLYEKNQILKIKWHKQLKFWNKKFPLHMRFSEFSTALLSDGTKHYSL